MNKIINTYAYIIHIETERTKREYTDAKLCKIGEGTKKRPFTLIEKYGLDSSFIIKDLIELNLNNKVRITDGNIRSYILSNYPDIKLEVDYKVAMLLGIPEDSKRNDGFTECLIVPDKYNIVNLVTEAVEYFKKHKKEATGKPKYSYTIDYDVKHLVNLDLCNRIYNFLLRESGLGVDLYNTHSQEILFIGQFDNIFLNRIACRNNITLFIDDTKKYESTLTLDNFNIKIIYSTEELEELMGEKDFGIVISNPPYGKIGAEITKNIIDNIDYKVFINLLPANDYKRGNINLYKYVDVKSMTYINKGFADASVTTHLAKINNKPSNITEDEFEISNYTDRSLDKFFYEIRKRKYYAIDNVIYKPSIEKFKTIDLKKCFYYGKRVIPNKHMPYKKDCISYKVNFNLLTDHDEFLVNSAKSEQALGNAGDFSIIEFVTEIEKNNFTAFVYSKNGFRFMSKIFTAVNADSYVAPNKFTPKVDWLRPWTVEEILADYGYTDNEIKEVMDDLVNFKYMED